MVAALVLIMDLCGRGLLSVQVGFMANFGRCVSIWADDERVDQLAQQPR